jgi:hypothetical protein
VHRRRDVVIGLAVGAIPLTAGLIGAGAAFNSGATDVTTGHAAGLAAALGSLELAVTLHLLFWLMALGPVLSADLRGLGLGMVVTLLASPVVYHVSCLALIRAPRG